LALLGDVWFNEIFARLKKLEDEVEGGIALGDHKKEKEKDSGAEIFFKTVEAMIDAMVEAKLGSPKEVQVKENILDVEATLDDFNGRLEELEGEEQVKFEAVEVSDYTEVLERIAESLRIIALGTEV